MVSARRANDFALGIDLQRHDCIQPNHLCDLIQFGPQGRGGFVPSPTLARVPEVQNLYRLVAEDTQSQLRSTTESCGVVRINTSDTHHKIASQHGLVYQHGVPNEVRPTVAQSRFSS
jgi:hypothetical protein